MKIKFLLLVAVIFVLLLPATTSIARSKDVKTINEKVEALLSQMTLDEKMGQMNQFTSRWEMTGPAPAGDNEQNMLEMIKSGLVGSMLNVTGAEATRKAQKLAVENSRLHIPMIFGYDVIHGFKTMFPIPLAEAASWDPSLAEKSARVAALEASSAGLQWTFGPMVDVARDARWGRIMEGAGEDPYLGAKFAAARVKGFQGNDLNDVHSIAACAKHYASYGFVEAGLDYSCVDIGEATMRNIVLPPFKAAVDAGTATLMNAFNEIGGVPATANTHLLRDILKGEWGFDGFVVSDWNSIGEMVIHGFAEDNKDAARYAIIAGSDMDMEGRCYVPYIKELVEEGTIDEKLVDDAVRRILKIKFELGLFDDPYRYSDIEREKNNILSTENLVAAKEVALKSIVLLKNDRGLLPLKKEGQRIALIGELSADKNSPLGSWRARAVAGSAVSVLEGMQALIKDQSTLQYSRGPQFVVGKATFRDNVIFNESDTTGLSEAVAVAREADVVVITLGEHGFQTGEGRGQTDINLKGLQQELLEAVYAVNKNVVVVLMNGRPLSIPWMAEHVPSIVEAWHLGSESGNAIAEVLFGDYNPAGKLPVSFPFSVGQLPLYYNHKNSGRPEDTGSVFWTHYSDSPKIALFPFGHGLSYTTFEYSDLELSSESLKTGDDLIVRVKVKNTGQVSGEEVVQLYIHDLVASNTRPVKELKGFKKIALEPGEIETVEFKLGEAELSFYGADGKLRIEPGKFNLWVGTSSVEGLEAAFVLK